METVVQVCYHRSVNSDQSQHRISANDQWRHTILIQGIMDPCEFQVKLNTVFLWSHRLFPVSFNSMELIPFWIEVFVFIYNEIINRISKISNIKIFPEINAIMVGDRVLVKNIVLGELFLLKILCSYCALCI